MTASEVTCKKEMIIITQVISTVTSCVIESTFPDRNYNSVTTLKVTAET